MFKCMSVPNGIVFPKSEEQSFRNSGHAHWNGDCSTGNNGPSECSDCSDCSDCSVCSVCPSVRLSVRLSIHPSVRLSDPIFYSFLKLSFGKITLLISIATQCCAWGTPGIMPNIRLCVTVVLNTCTCTVA